MPDAQGRAERLLREFARATNLTLAGRAIEVTGASQDPDVAQALRQMAAGMGMRTSGGGTGLAPLTVELGRTPRLLLGGEPLPSREDADARIAFAAEHMPVSGQLARELAASGALEGRSIGVCLPLEPKTAVLTLALREAGARVSVYAHPDETDAEVAEALRRRGLPVSADATRTRAEERTAALDFVRSWLDLLIDDGAHLIRLAHAEAPEHVRRWIGASEETTSGVRALQAMARDGALLTPVVATNDAPTKTAFDNRYGTGQSCALAIADLLEPLGITVRDQPAVVVGYGPVGQGVAAHLRALGAEVSVAEADALRALLAQHDGFEVGPLAALAPGALVVSATGIPGTIPADVAATARVIAVAGGSPGEVDPAAQAAGALVLGDGGAVNLTAAEGNPIEIMDLSFATQLVAVEHLVTSPPRPGLHALPDAACARVAGLAAAARSIKLEPVAVRGEGKGPGRFGGRA